MNQWAKPEFELLASSKWVLTEKVDGTNIRVIWDGENVLFRGKTDRAQIHTELLSHLSAVFTVEAMEGVRPMVLYGEGYGAKIQKGGGNYSPSMRFVLFDVFSGGLWLERGNVLDIGARLNTDVVPVRATGTLYDAIDMCELGFASSWGEFQAEGLVCRPKVELLDRRGERIITKIKCKDFRG